MSKSNIIIFGYSGHAKVVIDCFESHDNAVVGYFDKTKAENNVHGLEYLGFESEVDLSKVISNHDVFPAIGDNSLRSRVISLIRENHLKQTRAIHRSAVISNYTKIGLSSMIGPGAVINSGVEIGDGVIINSNATVEHDCFIEDFCHIAPGSTLAGNVTVGKNTFIGAGAVIKQGLIIGNNVIIGAGAVVLNNVPDNETWAGVPAKNIK